MDNRGYQEDPKSRYNIPKASLKNQAYGSTNPELLYEALDKNRRTIEQRYPSRSNGTTVAPNVVVPLKEPPVAAGEEEEGATYGDLFEDLDLKPSSPFSKVIDAIQSMIQSSIQSVHRWIKPSIIFTMFVLYNAYFIGTIVHNRKYNEPIAWCDGLGLLIILTAIVYWSLFYYHVLKRFAGKAIYDNVFVPIGKTWDKCWKFVVFRLLFIVLIVGAVVTFLVIDTADNRRRLISACGILVIVIIGLVISKHPSHVVWRHVFWGVLLQFIFGLLILRWEPGKEVLDCVSNKVARFLEFSDVGEEFVYGFTAMGIPDLEIGVTFAFGLLSVIFYFSFVVAMLYYTGAMTWVVIKVGWLLQITIGTTAAESMSASANIFLGMTEAPLVIKPFIHDLTNSELHAVMTGGFATIAGTVMGAFISFGISPSHLLSASFMSAPAALALAKLIHPETKVSRTTAASIHAGATKSKSKNDSFLDAAVDGASQAVHLVWNIIASLIAITSFVAFLDAILSWFGSLLGFSEFSFQWLLTKLFYPFAVIIGIETEELETVSRLLGMKTVVNEFVAYLDLAELIRTDAISPRSTAIATYALCSFSNFSSIGIMLGGLGALSPKRRVDMAKTMWRAFIAGNLACLMTACIAGTLTTEMGYSEWMDNRNSTNITAVN